MHTVYIHIHKIQRQTIAFAKTRTNGQCVQEQLEKDFRKRDRDKVIECAEERERTKMGANKINNARKRWEISLLNYFDWIIALSLSLCLCYYYFYLCAAVFACSLFPSFVFRFCTKYVNTDFENGSVHRRNKDNEPATRQMYESTNEEEKKKNNTNNARTNALHLHAFCRSMWENAENVT